MQHVRACDVIGEGRMYRWGIDFSTRSLHPLKPVGKQQLLGNCVEAKTLACEDGCNTKLHQVAPLTCCKVVHCCNRPSSTEDSWNTRMAMWSNWFWLKLCVVLETYKREFSLFVKSRAVFLSLFFVPTLNNKMFEVLSLRLFFRCERLKEDESHRNYCLLLLLCAFLVLEVHLLCHNFSLP